MLKFPQKGQYFFNCGTHSTSSFILSSLIIYILHVYNRLVSIINDLEHFIQNLVWIGNI